MGIGCEYDFGWDKRGNGFFYDRRSRTQIYIFILIGMASTFYVISRTRIHERVGHETGKIVAWEVKTTACAKFDKEHPSDDHVCRKNHSGSSKSMEPASAVSLLVGNKNFEECNVRTDVLVGDEDAATIAHVQKASSHLMKKWSDKNHVLKKF